MKKAKKEGLSFLKRALALAYPASQGRADDDMNSHAGVDEVCVVMGPLLVVRFRDGTALTMGELNDPPSTCKTCGGSGLKPGGSGDACEACTYWVEGAPCQTREQVFAEVVSWVETHEGFAEWDKDVEPDGERARINEAIVEFGLGRRKG
jgi:hypothetical protein